MKTGHITPRDYGITIQKDNERLFLSPMKYILGKVMLETPGQIRRRIKSHADSIEENPKKIEREFIKSVKKKEKSKNILNISRRDVLNDTKRYANNYISKVQSKSSDEIYNTRLLNSNSIGYEGLNCSCPDKVYNDVKSLQSMCVHLGALEIALKEDSNLSYDSNRNNTALTKSQLKYLPTLAFDLFNLNNQDLINNAIFDYYLENKTSYQINKEVLNNDEIFSKELKQLLQENSDIVQYRPTRQRDRNINLPNKKQREFYGAIRSLQKRLHHELIKQGFDFDGYSLEKVNNVESIAFRYKNGFQVMSLCNFENEVPTILQKNLGNKSNRDYPKTKSLSTPYLSLDDATKRESLTQIILPGDKQFENIFIPQILKKEYDKINSIS